jgi:hypothetical protein
MTPMPPVSPVSPVSPVRPAPSAPRREPPAVGPLLGVGTVRHQRLRPAAHAFAYRTWFVLLPMRRLRTQPAPALNRNGRGWVSFHDRDHGDGGPDALAWAEGQLAAAGIQADGEIWLHTLPRILGYAFKPVSFWYAHRADGTLAAVIAEVNSTFGERRSYLLHGPDLGWGRPIEADKAMQVSPFARIEGHYRFRFMRTDLALSSQRVQAVPPVPEEAPDPAGPGAGARTVVRIDYHDRDGELLRTSVSGRLQPLQAPALRAVLWRMPLLTFGVIARIHWQALRLWLRRVPFIGTDGHVPGATATPGASPPSTPSASAHPTASRPGV